jgi:hypothetical protein
MNLLALAIGQWTPQIGDPSFWGWLTVYAYYGAAGICLFAAGVAHYRKIGPDRSFWEIMFAYMAFLGACKQFNLPSALTEIGKLLANSEGWINNRRIVQVIFMGVFGIAIVFGATFTLRRIKHYFLRKFKLTLLFSLYLFVFIALRAISLHQYEEFLDYTVFGLRFNTIGELGGIYAICLLAATSGFSYFFKNDTTIKR